MSSLQDQFSAKLVQAYLGIMDVVVSRFVHGKFAECNIDRYPSLCRLEQNWNVIQEELDALLNNLPEMIQYEKVDKRYSRQVGHSTKTQTKNEWRIEQFYLYGKRIKRGCNRAPRTAALLRSIPRVQTALFSVLEPGSHIKPHRGEYSGVLRYHLGVKIPSSSDCQLRVEDRLYNWQEGKSFIFDHTDEHEAWNNSNKRRAILIVDFARQLPFPLSVLNAIGLKLLQISPHIRHAVTTIEIGPSQTSSTEILKK